MPCHARGIAARCAEVLFTRWHAQAGEGDDQAGHEHSPGIGEEEEEDPAAAGYDAWLAGGAGAAPASAANTSGLASDSTAVAYGAGAARALYASPPEAGGRQNRPGSAGGDVAFSQPHADAAAYTPILVGDPSLSGMTPCAAGSIYNSRAHPRMRAHVRRSSSSGC